MLIRNQMTTIDGYKLKYFTLNFYPNEVESLSISFTCKKCGEMFFTDAVPKDIQDTLLEVTRHECNVAFGEKYSF